MIRLNSRSNRSRGRHLADVGRPARPGAAAALAAPALAISGAIRRGRLRAPPCRRCRPPGAAQSRAGHDPGGRARRRPSGRAGADRAAAPVAEARLGRQVGAGSRRRLAASRLAPQALQKLPGGGRAAGGTGGGRGRHGHGAEAYTRQPGLGKCEVVAALPPGRLPLPCPAGPRPPISSFRRGVPIPYVACQVAVDRSTAERPSLEDFPTDLTRRGKGRRARALTQRFGVDFLRLQFTDILGINKNVEVPPAASSRRRSTARSCSTAPRSRGSCGSRSRDMLLKPDLAHLPHPPLRRRRRPGRAAALRHLHAGRASRSPAAPAPRSSARSSGPGSSASP